MSLIDTSTFIWVTRFLSLPRTPLGGSQRSNLTFLPNLAWQTALKSEQVLSAKPNETASLPVKKSPLNTVLCLTSSDGRLSFTNSMKFPWICFSTLILLHNRHHLAWEGWMDPIEPYAHLKWKCATPYLDNEETKKENSHNHPLYLQVN